MAEASPALRNIVDTILLAPRFALVVVVGPDDRPQLAQWTLHEQLVAAGLEVLWHSLAEDGLSECIEGAQSEHPVVLLSEIDHLDRSEREELLVRLNLQRDAVGNLPARLVYWCSHRGIDELRRVAPDFLHWRSLLQELTVDDLPITGWRTYMAWCVDEYSERDDDRVREGGTFALRDPWVHSSDIPFEAVRFSMWVDMHGSGIVERRALMADPRYPAKELARRWGLMALRGAPDIPLPVVATVAGLGDALRERAELIDWPRNDMVVFIIDGGEPIDTATLLAVHQQRRARVFVITSRASDWEAVLDWPCGKIVRDLDVFSPGLGPFSAALHALAEILSKLFDKAGLHHFMSGIHDLADGFSLVREELTPRAQAEQVVDWLLSSQYIDTKMFERLLELRPRSRAEIERVRQMFVDLSAQRD